MSKFVLPMAFIFVVFLASCSNPQGSVLTSQDKTLRNAVMEKNSKTVWTKEVEPDRLKAKINSPVQVQNKEYISPQMFSSIKQLQPAVYPEIKDFASLDVSGMNKSILQTVTELCDSLCKGTENLGNFFDSEYFYNCVFFTKDLNDLLQPDEKSEKLFDRYLVCKGFEGEEIIQVPVRFYKDKETLDLSVYLTYHGGYKVIQIEILGWGKQYGESEKTK